MRTFTIFLTFFFISANLAAQTISGTYAIQNIKTGKNLRPYEAGSQDGNKIVLYNHVDWKCMTWDFIHIDGDIYLLKNLYTSKTFQPHGNTSEGCTLEQRKIVPGSVVQEWEFVSADKGYYYIRLKGTELYITLSDASGTTNSSIILLPKQDSDLQLWKLVRQNPTM